MTSRSHIPARFCFTLSSCAALLACLGTSSTAHADSVVVLETQGEATAAARSEIAAHVIAAIQAENHVVSQVRSERTRVPSTSPEFAAIATRENAHWVVTVSVQPLRAQYRLSASAFYATRGRLEEITVLVIDDESESARLRDVFRCMLRESGLGEDALRLTADTSPANTDDAAAREAAERARLEAEARAAEAQRDQLAREALAREEQARRDRDAVSAREDTARAAATAQVQATRDWNARILFTHSTKLLAVGAGFGFSAVIPQDARRAGGVLVTVPVRLGYAISALRGLELRGGLDIVAGATNGLAIVGGVAYGYTPFTAPLHIGATFEIAAYISFSGARDVAALMRFAPLVSYSFSETISVEALLPDVSFLSAGSGAWTVGASARLRVILD